MGAAAARDFRPGRRIKIEITEPGCEIARTPGVGVSALDRVAAVRPPRTDRGLCTAWSGKEIRAGGLPVKGRGSRRGT